MTYDVTEKKSVDEKCKFCDKTDCSEYIFTKVLDTNEGDNFSMFICSKCMEYIMSTGTCGKKELDISYVKVR